MGDRLIRLKKVMEEGLWMSGLTKFKINLIG